MKTWLFTTSMLIMILNVNYILAQEESATFKFASVQSTNSLTTYNFPVSEESLWDGLVMYLPFDRNDTGSNKVIDASGQGCNGKASGVFWTPDGKKGGAYEFKVDGDKIEVQNNALLNPKQLTLSAWVKTTCKDGQWRRIFDKSYSQGYALSIAGEWQGNIWNGQACMEMGPEYHFNSTRSMVADGQWHHVVATFDGTEQLLFVDGKPEGRPLQWSNYNQIGSSDFNLNIGCNGSDSSAVDFGVSFRGLIDEPMLWNRPLSVKEVAFLYQMYPSTSSDIEQALNKNDKSQSLELWDNNVSSKWLNGIKHLTDNDVRFRTSDGINVFVDPVSFPTDELVIKSGIVKPDLILITHSHIDHLCLSVLREYLNLNPNAILVGPKDVAQILKSNGMLVSDIIPNKSYTMANIKFTTVPAYFLENKSHPKEKEWVGYVLHIDGMNYYITGDTQPFPEMKNLKVDALLPLLYGCGGNIDQTVVMIEMTQTHIVIPVHHSRKEGTIKQLANKIPEKVQCYYTLDGKWISAQ